TWSFSPFVLLTKSWDPSNQLLTFTHNVGFGCGLNTMQITDGKDVSGGDPLIAGPAPNPWTFQPDCPNPYITATSPVNGATGVGLTDTIVVTFNKPMNTITVGFTLVPAIGAFTYSWNTNAPANTTVTISHASAFGQSTNYTALIAGQDTDGNLLVAGPVPNPWRFRTVGLNPQILSTNPANAATGAATTANIVVAFSEAMNTTTVTLTTRRVLAFACTWSNG